MSASWLFLAIACSSDPSGENAPDKGTAPEPTEPVTPEEPVDPEPEEPVEGILLVNEVMSDNESTVQNDDDTFPDWIELYNPGTEPVSLRDVRIADDSGAVWEGGAGVVGPKGTVVLYADESEAPDHLPFSLSSSGGETLKVMVGTVITDEVVIPALPSDVSYQRFPDGDAYWVGTTVPTPGEANETPSATLDPVDTALTDGEIHQIEWTINEAQYNIINSSSEEWGWAEASIDGIHYAQIAVRLKGSASFDLMDGKPQFKIDLNEHMPEARWQNLKGFKLHNGNILDPTRTRDFLSYQLARESGLMAPRVGWAELYVNGNYFGIYMMIEDYDNKMIEHTFPGQGDLGAMFEPNESQDGGWGGGDFCQGNIEFNYEEGPVPMDPLVLEALNNASTICGRVATDENILQLWDHVEKDAFLTYMAWETLIQHGDGYKSPNNWRVYVDTSYKVHLVPAGAEWTWDYVPSSWSFGGDMASFCLENNGCKREYAVKLLEMADRVELLDLHTQFSDLTAWLDPIIDLDPRSPHSDTDVANARGSTNTRLQDNPDDVRRDVEDTFPGLEYAYN